MKLLEIIKNRRTIKPNQFNGEFVNDDIIKEMLQAADWAPTHKMTEPWRFIVFKGEAKKQFSLEHANLFKKIKTAEGKIPEEFINKKYEKIQFNGDKASHIIALVMKRDEAERVPEIEEICSVACAVQNMMLVATENKVAHIWSSGGMCFHPEMKTILGFEEKDKVLGFLYLGKSDLKPKSKRFISLEEKVVWKK